MFAEPLWQTLLPTIMYSSSIELAEKCQSHSNFRCGLSCRLGGLCPPVLQSGGAQAPPAPLMPPPLNLNGMDTPSTAMSRLHEVLLLLFSTVLRYKPSSNASSTVEMLLPLLLLHIEL